ncbi:hypothetical protein [Micromonospora sp. NPDC092111]|uniref:hypothetical protein n=1 Tax=Micromonospora sp. NPDC092111 TaxID=3364289 RepID=UPI0037F5446C
MGAGAVVTGLRQSAGAVNGNGIDRVPATRRFDPRRHRRIAGLFDLWLAPGPAGRLVVPTDPDRPLDARAVAGLVRRAGDAAADVRILADDGARHLDLFTEVAGLLGHDVLISPEGADIRHATGRPTGTVPGDTTGDGPLHAVPLHRVTRQPMDWLVLQPPDLATPLPGWFAMDDGLVRPRTGVVGLPLPDGLALATRADFVTRRATAHRLGVTSEGLVTVAVTARSGGFLVGNYSGTQQVHRGGQLAALLGDLPLYGADLRLWLTWPSDPDEQAALVAQAVELAETTGATVWTPPPGGRAELVDDQRDLRALDPAGTVAPWQAHRPRYAAGPATLDATADGRLVSRLTRQRIVVASAAPGGTVTGPAPADVTSTPHRADAISTPDRVDTTSTPDRVDTRSPAADRVDTAPSTPDAAAGTTSAADRVGLGAATAPPSAPAADPAVAVLVPPLPRPALVTENRRAPGYGPPWLRRGQQVNVEEFEAFVLTSGDLARTVADGVPGTELFLAAFLDPRSAPTGSDLLRVRIGPGGAIPMAVLRAHVPARFKYLLGTPDTYLLPAARLDRVRVRGGFRAEGFGRLLPCVDADGEPLRIRSAPAARSVAGLPNDVRRWPGFGTRKAYALLPARSRGLPRRWLPLYRQRPEVRPGRLLVEVRVPRGRTVDVAATDAMLSGLTLVQTRVQRLHRAGVELILGSRSYDRVRVQRAYRVQAGVWQRLPNVTSGPLPVAVGGLQTGRPVRTADSGASTGPT